jgi:ferredoxin--NADP+ reductase
LPDVPFDERSGTIPNRGGRVITRAGEQVIGEYVVGWIKRGPTGIIGTNKHDAQDTVTWILEDVRNETTLQPAEPARAAVEALLCQRKIQVVSYADWQIVDQLELEHGQASGRPRLKFASQEDMLAALAERKRTPVPETSP